MNCHKRIRIACIKRRVEVDRQLKRGQHIHTSDWMDGPNGYYVVTALSRFAICRSKYEITRHS